MIDKKRLPLYLQLAENIKRKILNGTYDIGSKIPSEREMASMYGITRVTVRRALDSLIKEGILIANVGSGTYVSKIPQEKRINLGEGSSSRLTLDIRGGGMNPSKVVLGIEKINNNLEDIFPNEIKLFRLTRLMLIDEIPYAVQIAHLPLSLFEDAERCDFKNTSLYDYMEGIGHKPKKISSSLRIIDMPKKYSRYFNVRKKTKVFSFIYLGYDDNNVLVEYTESYNLPKFTEYRFTIKRF